MFVSLSVCVFCCPVCFILQCVFSSPVLLRVINITCHTCYAMVFYNKPELVCSVWSVFCSRHSVFFSSIHPCDVFSSSLCVCVYVSGTGDDTIVWRATTRPFLTHCVCARAQRFRCVFPIDLSDRTGPLRNYDFNNSIKGRGSRWCVLCFFLSALPSSFPPLLLPHCLIQGSVM